MNFIKRLLFFLFGFSIGLIFLFYLMDKKDATFNYSPNKRVLADISKKKWILQNGNEFLGIKKQNLVRDYYVNFSKSNVKLDSCKTYLLVEKFDETISYYVVNCSKKATFKKSNL